MSGFAVRENKNYQYLNLSSSVMLAMAVCQCRPRNRRRSPPPSSIAYFKRLLQLRFDCDSTSIRLRSTTTKNEHVHFFVASRGVVANKKAAVGSYNDAIVYVTAIFTLTDEHRVASFDYRRWFSPFTHFRSKMSSGMHLCLH